MTAALRLLALLQTLGSTLALAVAVDALAARDPLAILFAVLAAVVAVCGYLTATLSYPTPADEPAPEAP